MVYNLCKKLVELKIYIFFCIKMIVITHRTVYYGQCLMYNIYI